MVSDDRRAIDDVEVTSAWRLYPIATRILRAWPARAPLPKRLTLEEVYSELRIAARLRGAGAEIVVARRQYCGARNPWPAIADHLAQALASRCGNPAEPTLWVTDPSWEVPQW